MRFQDLQTCFDHRLVIVVARGEAKEGLDYIDKKFSESDQKSAARCDGVWRSLAKEFSALRVLSRVPSPQQSTSRYCVDF